MIVCVCVYIAIIVFYMHMLMFCRRLVPAYVSVDILGLNVVKVNNVMEPFKKSDMFFWCKIIK